MTTPTACGLVASWTARAICLVNRSWTRKEEKKISSEIQVRREKGNIPQMKLLLHSKYSVHLSPAVNLIIWLMKSIIELLYQSRYWVKLEENDIEIRVRQRDRASGSDPIPFTVTSDMQKPQIPIIICLPCNLLLNISTILANLLNPITCPFGMYPICAFPKNGTIWCSHMEKSSMSLTRTNSLWSSLNTASLHTSKCENGWNLYLWFWGLEKSCTYGDSPWR